MTVWSRGEGTFKVASQCLPGACFSKPASQVEAGRYASVLAAQLPAAACETNLGGPQARNSLFPGEKRMVNRT